MGRFRTKKMKIDTYASPVFLLDSNRMHRHKAEISLFDNSWDIYEQDIPTAEYFLNSGITKIIVSGRIINRDLNKILYNFQKKGIEIFFTNGYEEVEKVKLRKIRRENLRLIE